MSRLMRMAYGHGGTRLERIAVAAPPPESAAAPRWLRLLMLAVWLCVPVLVSRYAVPTTPQPTTVIDTSRLELLPPVLPEPLRVEPVEPQPQPPVPLQNDQKPLEQPLEEASLPTITRPTAPRAPNIAEYQPRIVRERARAGTEAVTTRAEHIRRTAAAAMSPVEATTITRTRGAAATDAPAAVERLAPLRRAGVPEGAPAGTEPHRITRQRSAGATEEVTPRIVAARERGPRTAAAEERGSLFLAHSRGVSLASLDICASPREEEEKITAVLSAVGERPSCQDGSGKYDFRGTRRISSFNLIIYPAKGRRPSNRCEELDNAYRCLKGR